ncbi:putative transcription factor bHLH family [Rosa chinensis]|uniref:Putative transcription factor bHLH family n=1 Tax=Rosa chinensis TaxID=74649 RepID=A0A2P6P2I6_ROSCH|nr:transcription factor bHLH47 [Rosa chinensis]PRQ16143.1 putative transcription factor bHLH family [Rosa chinensis]
MGSKDPAPVVDKVNEATQPVDRVCPGKKIQGKMPKRIHKAVREKQKREHLNDLFLDLSDALELNQQNTGKATILCEATRLLKDLLGQIESLRNENVSLLSESNYMTVEKNELREDTSALETQIERLQSELQERVRQSKPDLNVPPVEVRQEVASHFPGNCVGFPAQESGLQQAPAVFVMPLHPDLQTYPPADSAHLTSKINSNVSKPHPRYPTSVDSWPFQLLSEQPAAGKDSRQNGHSTSGYNGHDNM